MGTENKYRYVNFEEIVSDQREENSEKYGYEGDIKGRSYSDVCLCCGKPIYDDSRKKYTLHLFTNGLITNYPKDLSGEFSSKDQGMFMVGASCYKKFLEKSKIGSLSEMLKK